MSARRIQGALALRSWTLAALGAERRAEPPPSPPRASPAAWSLFLGAERCAVRVRALLGSRLEGLPSEVAERVRWAAGTEARRALAARATLADVEGVAAGRGWSAVVLKGGLSQLLDAEPLDTGDVDVLVQPERCRPLLRSLERRGYRPVMAPSGTGLPDREPRAPEFHYPPVIGPGSLPVEIHRNIKGVGDAAAVAARALPIPGHGGLTRPAPPDHLWHLLFHATVHHRYRRGRLRDLLMIVRAIEACSPAELRAVRIRAATHSHSAHLARAVTLAEELTEGRVRRDPFRREAAALYLALGTSTLAALPSPLRSGVCGWVLLLLGSAADRREHGRKVLLARPTGLSSLRAVAMLERPLPRLGKGVRRTLRWIRESVSLALAAPVALACVGLAIGTRDGTG